MPKTDKIKQITWANPLDRSMLCVSCIKEGCARIFNHGTNMHATDQQSLDATTVTWSAVYAVAFSAAVIVGCEFLPVSLLSPIAHDFAVSEGRAGQIISVSGIFAILTSLSASRLTRAVDRKTVMLGFAVSLLLSNLIVATATNFPVLMLGRVLLGISVGGFWSFSTAVTMRLLPQREVSRGLALIGSAVAVSTTVSAPLASSLGDILGWRGTFLLTVPVAGLSLGWLWISLPKLPPNRKGIKVSSLRLLRNRQVALATTAALLLFMGQFVIFTYIRPLLETTAGFSVPAMSSVLLAMGLFGVVGSWWGGLELRKSLFRPLILLPALLSVVGLGLVFLGTSQPAVIGLFITWGFLSSAANIGWGMWLSHALPGAAEAGGGLQVAAIQLAIACGALVGGLVLDIAGWQASIAVGVVVLIGAALAAAATAADFTGAEQ